MYCQSMAFALLCLMLKQKPLLLISFGLPSVMEYLMIWKVTAFSTDVGSGSRIDDSSTAGLARGS